MEICPISVLNNLNQQKIIPRPIFKIRKIKHVKCYQVYCIVSIRQIYKISKAYGVSVKSAKIQAAKHMCHLLKVDYKKDILLPYMSLISIKEWKILCDECKLLKLNNPLVNRNKEDEYQLRFKELKIKTKITSLVCACIQMLIKLANYKSKNKICEI